MRVITLYFIKLRKKLSVFKGELIYKIKILFINKQINNNKNQFDLITSRELKRWFSAITLPDRQLASYSAKTNSKHNQSYSEIAMDLFGNIKHFTIDHFK